MESDRALCGWRVRTEIPLPQLPPWQGEPAGPPLLILRHKDGNFPSPGKSRRLSLLTSAFDDGSWQLRIPSIGKILVSGGREIRLAQLESATNADLGAAILGPVFSMCCAQRGLIPLRATVIAGGQGAIMLCGATGVGKSAIATHLVKGGWTLVSDGVTVVGVGGGRGGIVALHTYPWLQFWRRAALSLDLVVDDSQRVRPCLEKYWYRGMTGLGTNRMHPIRDIVWIERNEDRTRLVPTQKTSQQLVNELVRYLRIEPAYAQASALETIKTALGALVQSSRSHSLHLEDDLEAAELVGALPP
jgi:hypothetical protein